MSVTKEPESELIRAKDLGTFDRWALPSFDPPGDAQAEAEPAVEEPAPAAEADVDEAAQVEEVALEDVKPLTLDEVEAIRQDAYNEGFATGEKDGFHAGQLKAKQEADAALALKLDGLEKLMQQLLEPIAEQDQQVEVVLHLLHRQNEAHMLLLGQVRERLDAGRRRKDRHPARPLHQNVRDARIAEAEANTESIVRAAENRKKPSFLWLKTYMMTVIPSVK